jgi:L-aminopeptidase/D-esterase-like protein
MKRSNLAALALLALACPAWGAETTKPRARDLGIPFEGTPGPRNAITDVAGVEVGNTTLIRGKGKLERGVGPVRTGVTAIFPRGHLSSDLAFAGWFPLNGNGEVTGAAWVEESGFLEGPFVWTNTHSVGVARDAVIAWRVKHGEPDAEGYWWSLPVVGETWDGDLNDINGFHVKPEHVFEALSGAKGGAVPEGNVGSGTGMVCFDFKGGIGTASRVVTTGGARYTLGALVQCNCGRREQLTIAGAPVGREIPDLPFRVRETGSILIAVATDAPLLPHQLERVARRASLGLARLGSTSGNGSGDFVLAFSTANPGAATYGPPPTVTMLPNSRLDPLFDAAVEATEEAIVNSLVAAETMDGIDGAEARAIPHDRLREALKKYRRLAK